jgi:hypothetical protein
LINYGAEDIIPLAAGEITLSVQPATSVDKLRALNTMAPPYIISKNCTELIHYGEGLPSTDFDGIWRWRVRKPEGKRPFGRPGRRWKIVLEWILRK